MAHAPESGVDESRRSFLKVSALAGGGFAVGIFLPSAAPLAAAPVKPFAPNAWIRIGGDNWITVIVDKSEMGQGVYTSLPMIVAEELDADWSKVRVEAAPAAAEYRHPWFGVQATGGSTSVRAMWRPLRQAGASARAMLVAAAAETWNVKAARLRTEGGSVIGPGGKKATYGRLAAKAAAMPVPQDVKLKDPKDFKIIGHPMKRLDTPGKVDGTAKFGIDADVPGMLIALVARSSIVGGTLAAMDEGKAKAVNGVKMVLPVTNPTGEGVAVLADSFWAAQQGRNALAAQWRGDTALSSAGLQRAMMGLIESGKDAVTARREGDVAAASPPVTVEAVYEAPYLAHAAMEPMNCTAWVKRDGVEIWAPTQAPGVNQAVAAEVTGMKPEQVQVHTTLLGGGFGRRFAPDFLIEAVQLSKAAQVPVKVVYTREDDTRAYYYRPMALCRLVGGLDGDGNPVSLDVRTVCESLSEGSGFEAALIKDGVDSTAVEGLSNQPYAVPNVNVEWVKYSPGIRTWFWRSVGSSQNVFFIESFIDEMAHAAGKDPVVFRRALLAKHPRHKAVLELAAAKADWGRSLPAGRARGIAVAESFGSYIAQVAEVSLEDGKPRVHRVVIAADVGTVVNPDTVAAQMESGMVYGLTAALYGRITFKDGQVEQSNFHDYPMLRINEMPNVEVHLVPSGEAPGGVGEPATPVIAPAVANALFALTGKRIRRLPLAV